jgi:hypothetical protein
LVINHFEKKSYVRYLKRSQAQIALALVSASAALFCERERWFLAALVKLAKYQTSNYYKTKKADV